MIRRALAITPAILGSGLSFVAVCQAHQEHVRADLSLTPAQPAATAAETKPSSHVWEARGVRVTCPAGWQEKKDPDFELFLVPPGPAPTSPDIASRITFDVPDLPPHLPFMIQMSRIEHDYEADLKKAHPDLKIENAVDVKIPDTTARLLQSSWHENGQPHSDIALLMIHASGVYILDAQAGEKQLPATRAAFESMRASLRWTK